MRRLALVAAAVALMSGCMPNGRDPDAPKVQIYALDCGLAAFDDVDLFADDGSMAGQARTLVDPCYLIRHPSGDLIWDTGFGDALAEQSEGMRVEEMHATFSAPVRLADQLAQIGVDPADIDFISFSHSHADHTGNAAMFPNAVWIVDADERDFMFRDEARAVPEFQAYARLENAETQLIEGDADYDVFGDGTVTIIQAPGHTPGHTVLLAQLPHAGAVLLSGDMYHLSESRSRSLVPRFNTDRAQTLASMEKIERIAREHDALVIRQHVREDFDAMPRFPDALN